MAICSNLIVIYTLLCILICANGNSINLGAAPYLNSIQGSGGVDQLTSGTVAKEVIPDSTVAANNKNAKGDLKGADSFGLGYYLPIVTPTLVKYHYPVVYYPTAYLHSIRHHGYGAYGFFHHGHGVIH